MPSRPCLKSTESPHALPCHYTAHLAGRVGLPSDVDAGSLGHLSFAEQSYCDPESVCSLSQTPHDRPTNQKSQVKFLGQDSCTLLTSQPVRPPFDSPSGNGILTLPPASYAIETVSSGHSAAALSLPVTLPVTEAEAATKRMAAAAALIEARQRSLDNFNVQLYPNRKYQHKIDGVEWHTTRQVPGDPWQPHQMQPTRVGMTQKTSAKLALTTSNQYKHRYCFQVSFQGLCSHVPQEHHNLTCSIQHSPPNRPRAGAHLRSQLAGTNSHLKVCPCKFSRLLNGTCLHCKVPSEDEQLFLVQDTCVY